LLTERQKDGHDKTNRCLSECTGTCYVIWYMAMVNINNQTEQKGHRMKILLLDECV
jgi:hypothetical protein